jgi:WD40 repeat protein
VIPRVVTAFLRGCAMACSGHDDDIVSLAVDPSGNFVATGQLGAKPRVHIWDSESGSRLCVLPLVHRRAIPCLAFSPDGKQLLSVGDDDNHTVALYSSATGGWTDGKLAGKAMGDPNKVLWAQFLPAGGKYTAATGGVKHVRFWSVGPSGLTSKKGIFGAKAAMQPMLCATTVGSNLVTGTVSGEMYIWEDITVARVCCRACSAVACGNDVWMDGTD